MHLFGYIDPGSGSLLLQALLAALLSVPFVFRRTIGGFWHRLRGTEPADEPAPSTADPSSRSKPGDR
jgi:hypothetical protein